MYRPVPLCVAPSLQGVSIIIILYSLSLQIRPPSVHYVTFALGTVRASAQHVVRKNIFLRVAARVIIAYHCFCALSHRIRRCIRGIMLKTDNVLRYTGAEKYQNGAWFDEVLQKRCNFGPHFTSF